MALRLTPTQALEYAVKIIFSHNSDANSKVCVHSLKGIIETILAHPEDAKYRRFKASKSPFAEQVANCKGGIEFLQACGFQQNETKHLIMANEVVDLAHLTKAKEILQQVERAGYQSGMARAGPIPDPVAQAQQTQAAKRNAKPTSSSILYGGDVSRLAMIEKDFYQFANHRLRPGGTVTQKEIVETFRFMFYQKYRYYGKQGNQAFTVSWRETEQVLWKWNRAYAHGAYSNGTYTGFHMNAMVH